MRELKFRAYFNDQMSHPFTLGEAVCWPCGKVSTANRVGKIMQYIGITDSDGVEVCQGDIITDNVGVGVIEYCDKYAGFRVNYNDGSCKWFYDYLDSERKILLVIGNIHENPELLNK